uniref:NDNF_C domain-containing protein n=1 Tax=Strongyloides papillosus TaxID=174720 RepID=A0A0N5C9E3_STREA
MNSVSFLDMMGRIESNLPLPKKNKHQRSNDESQNKHFNVLIHGMKHRLHFNKYGNNQIYQIYMPGKDYPFWMYITPCDCTLHWQLYMRNEFDNKDPIYTTTIDSDYNKKLNMESNLYVHVERNLRDANLILLAGQSGNKRMKFYAKDIESDLLFLNVTSYDCSSFEVLFTTVERQIDEFYAPLPDDTTLHYEVFPHKYDKNTIEKNDVNLVDINLSWEFDPKFEPFKYKHCAVLTRNFMKPSTCLDNRMPLEKMYCNVESNNNMTIEKIKIEKNMQILLYVFDLHMGSINVFPPLQINRTDMKFEEPYKDIFIGNDEGVPRMKTTTTTKLATVTIPPRITLPDGILYEASFQKNDGISQNFNYFVQPSLNKGNDSGKILLILNACSGYIRLSIFKGEVLLRNTEEITGFRRFLIMNVHEGSLRFEITNLDNESKKYKIWVSGRPTKSPYPQLPSEPSLKIVHRTCKTVTIQWYKAIDKKINYCMYRYPLNDTDLTNISFKSDPNIDYCYPKLSKKNIIGCYTSYGVEKDVYNPKGITSNSLIEATLEELIPNQVYKFEMFATKKVGKKSYHLPYRALIAKTMENCTN